MQQQVELDTLLNSEDGNAAVIAKYQRVMQHRTNEAMNGLSNRLDKLIEQAERNGKAQGRQQAAMIALTTVLAIATVAYTATTIYATRATVGAQQASNGSQTPIEYVRGSGAVPESAAVHMGTDEKGRAAVCVGGYAYDIPALGDLMLKARYQPARPDGALMPQLRCQN